MWEGFSSLFGFGMYTLNIVVGSFERDLLFSTEKILQVSASLLSIILSLSIF